MTFAARPIFFAGSAGSVGHKSWRMLITKADGGWGGISELEFLDESGARLPLSGGVAICSSFYASDTHPSFAFDGIFGDGRDWAAEHWSPPMWIGYRHKDPARAASVAVRARRGDIAHQAPTDFDIQYSDDESVWTTAWSVSGQVNWSHYERRVFPAPPYS